MEMTSRSMLILYALTSSARSTLHAQPAPLRLSLKEALSLVREKNKSVAVTGLEQPAAAEDWKDARNANLLQVGLGGSYQRYSGLILFSNGITGDYSSLRDPQPTSADVGLDASYTLFARSEARCVIANSTDYPA